MIEISYKKLDGTNHKQLIPICWRDITWSKFVQLKGIKGNELEKLAFISGIDLNILLTNPLFLRALIDSCAFLWDEDVEIYATRIKEEHKTTIASLEWGKLENAKSAISQSGANIWQAGNEVVKTYLDFEINDKPVTEVIGVVSFFLSKYQSLLNDLRT